mgnify:CR=1 FL=1
MSLKIVLPFLMNDENDLDSPKVSGGLERFSQFIYKYSEYVVIPFYYTREDRQKRTVTRNLLAFIENHQPDLVISNQDSRTITTNIQEMSNIPILWISHTAAGGIFKLPQVEQMTEFTSKGGTLAMVSEWQYNGMNKLCNRILGHNLELNGGFINSAFCSGDEEVSHEIKNDTVTIGRIDKEKDPFLLHKLAGNSNLSSLVLTSAYDLTSPQQKYLDKNKHWEGLRQTEFNLTHKEVMNKLSQSGVYLSTCPRETWGITALEAFARGIPVVLLKLSSNGYEHASEYIAPGPHFYQTISAKKQENFVEAVDILQKVDRLELSQKTKEKHSKKNWVKTLHNLIDKTIENNKTSNGITSWFV